MSRESCITHSPKQAISIVRQDYYELMNKDACAAALLNLFEYWANAALAAAQTTVPTIERPWVGARPIREFERMLLGIATDKQIRKRLALLAERGFIQVRRAVIRGAATAYRVMVPEIQRALAHHTPAVADEPAGVGCLTDERNLQQQRNVGHLTQAAVVGRSFDLETVGHLTQAASVIPPIKLRSNDRALKNSSKESKKEDLKEERKKDACVCQKKSSEPRDQTSSLMKVGSVSYQQPPEGIDLAELWESSPGMAKSQIRFLAPGHRRPEMVAHSVGHWWVGPGLNDFDEHLIQACRNRKRKFQQPDGIGDAKTFINNMLRNGDWGNFALRCEEAQVLRKRAGQSPVKQKKQSRQEKPSNGRSPFERSDTERRASALGLARFKVSRGDIEQAKAIARQFGLSIAELGLADGKPLTAAA